MSEWLKRKLFSGYKWKTADHSIRWYPSDTTCVKRDMSHVKPRQMPPLMVRKATWRR